MAQRYYSSTAVTTTLSGGINSGVTSITVGSVSGFPASRPYTLIIDPDGTEEVVEVTAAAGTTLTVTRGVDGSSAVSHLAGVTVRHGVSARDFSEPNTHVNSASGVHSVVGSVVGTTDSQTLTNKTLTSPTITTPTIASLTNMNHTHAAAGATGGTVAHSALTGLTVGDPHTQYQQETEKGAASGYASLDGTTKVPLAQIPTGTTVSTVALGNTQGYVAFEDHVASFPLTINGSVKTFAITGDIATDADYVYMVVAHVPWIDASGTGLITIFWQIEESYDSGGSWTYASTLANQSQGAADASSIFSSNEGTTQATGGVQLSIFTVPGARATCRWRLRAVRNQGSETADVTQANIHVIRVGQHLI